MKSTGFPFIQVIKIKVLGPLVHRVIARLGEFPGQLGTSVWVIRSRIGGQSYFH